MINKIKKIIKKIIKYDEYENSISGNEWIQYQRVKPWFKVNGDKTFRLNYNLNENSIVFDLGGYKGEFAEEIYNRYKSKIYIFEPVLEYYTIIKDKFSNNPQILPYQYGLAAKEVEMEISLNENASSIFIQSEDSETIQLKSIVDFIKTNNITKVDLIKINIEGGEYEVLESLLENDLIEIFDNVQVQFHDFVFENSKERMNTIQDILKLTHQITYQYEFVWENWKLK